jgi:tetratricopeptide (TPR) repeat protein
MHLRPPAGEYPYDLGAYTFKVTTTSPACQTWFDRGLNWSYGFHHLEAERCFRYAVACDPECAMAYWGIAYAGGPNYNKAWERFDELDMKQSLLKCHHAATSARKLATDPVEAAMAEAILKRFPSQREGDYTRWNRAFADEMEKVYAEFGDNLDVVAIYADSLMAMAPWELWDLQTGAPREDVRTLHIKEVLEKALLDRRALSHPGILHLYIHLMELSPTPELALHAADRLRNLVPDSGHLNHMPGHLDLLIGDYRRAIASNLDAIAADEKYMRLGSSTDFYTFYRLHDYTFPIYAAMFNGEAERELFRDARKRIAPTRFEFPNSWVDILNVGEAMLTGELEYRRANYAVAFESLREAIRRSDNLIYAEPWGWMQPPRHAYAALQLEQGNVEFAARTYAEDLGYETSLPRAVRHPNNVWALHGYHECLVKLGRTAEARIIEPQLTLALAVADVSIESSCFCRRVQPAANETMCCE